jgi:hypothetical protein
MALKATARQRRTYHFAAVTNNNMANKSAEHLNHHSIDDCP